MSLVVSFNVFKFVRGRAACDEAFVGATGGKTDISAASADHYASELSSLSVHQCPFVTSSPAFTVSVFVCQLHDSTPAGDILRVPGDVTVRWNQVTCSTNLETEGRRRAAGQHRCYCASMQIDSLDSIVSNLILNDFE